MAHSHRIDLPLSIYFDGNQEYTRPSTSIYIGPSHDSHDFTKQPKRYRRSGEESFSYSSGSSLRSHSSAGSATHSVDSSPLKRAGFGEEAGTYTRHSFDRFEHPTSRYYSDETANYPTGWPRSTSVPLFKHNSTTVARDWQNPQEMEEEEESDTPRNEAVVPPQIGGGEMGRERHRTDSTSSTESATCRRLKMKLHGMGLTAATAANAEGLHKLKEKIKQQKAEKEARDRLKEVNHPKEDSVSTSSSKFLSGPIDEKPRRSKPTLKKTASETNETPRLSRGSRPRPTETSTPSIISSSSTGTSTEHLYRPTGPRSTGARADSRLSEPARRKSTPTSSVTSSGGSRTQLRSPQLSDEQLRASVTSLPGAGPAEKQPRRPDLIGTSDWRRGQELIRRELGPNPLQTGAKERTSPNMPTGQEVGKRSASLPECSLDNPDLEDTVHEVSNGAATSPDDLLETDDGDIDLEDSGTKDGSMLRPSSSNSAKKRRSPSPALKSAQQCTSSTTDTTGSSCVKQKARHYDVQEIRSYLKKQKDERRRRRHEDLEKERSRQESLRRQLAEVRRRQLEAASASPVLKGERAVEEKVGEEQLVAYVVDSPAEGKSSLRRAQNETADIPHSRSQQLGGQRTLMQQQEKEPTTKSATSRSGDRVNETEKTRKSNVCSLVSPLKFQEVWPGSGVSPRTTKTDSEARRDRLAALQTSAAKLQARLLHLIAAGETVGDAELMQLKEAEMAVERLAKPAPEASPPPPPPPAVHKEESDADYSTSSFTISSSSLDPQEVLHQEGGPGPVGESGPSNSWISRYNAYHEAAQQQSYENATTRLQEAMRRKQTDPLVNGDSDLSDASLTDSAEDSYPVQKPKGSQESTSSRPLMHLRASVPVLQDPKALSPVQYRPSGETGGEQTRGRPRERARRGRPEEIGHVVTDTGTVVRMSGDQATGQVYLPNTNEDTNSTSLSSEVSSEQEIHAVPSATQEAACKNNPSDANRDVDPKVAYSEQDHNYDSTGSSNASQHQRQMADRLRTRQQDLKARELQAALLEAQGGGPLSTDHLDDAQKRARDATHNFTQTLSSMKRPKDNEDSDASTLKSTDTPTPHEDDKDVNQKKADDVQEIDEDLPVQRDYSDSLDETLATSTAGDTEPEEEVWEEDGHRTEKNRSGSKEVGPLIGGDGGRGKEGLRAVHETAKDQLPTHSTEDQEAVVPTWMKKPRHRGGDAIYPKRARPKEERDVNTEEELSWTGLEAGLEELERRHRHTSVGELTEEAGEDSSRAEEVRKRFSKMRLDKRMLTEREQKLHQRRKQAEELLQWKKKLDEEEERVCQLEMEAIKAWQSSNKPSSHHLPSHLEGSSKSGGRSRSSYSHDTAVVTHLEEEPVIQSVPSRDGQILPVEERATSLDAGKMRTKKDPQVSALDTSPPSKTHPSTSDLPPERPGEPDGEVDSEPVLTPRNEETPVTAGSPSSRRLKQRVGPMCSVLSSPRGPHRRPAYLHQHSTGEGVAPPSDEEDSMSCTQSETVSDVSEMESQIRALREELRRRQRTVAQLKRHRKHVIRENLKQKEQALQRHIEMYDKQIVELQSQISKEEALVTGSEGEQATPNNTRPKIKAPKAAIQQRSLSQGGSNGSNSTTGFIRALSKESEDLGDEDSVSSSVAPVEWGASSNFVGPEKGASIEQKDGVFGEGDVDIAPESANRVASTSDMVNATDRNATEDSFNKKEPTSTKPDDKNDEKVDSQIVHKTPVEGSDNDRKDKRPLSAGTIHSEMSDIPDDLGSDSDSALSKSSQGVKKVDGLSPSEDESKDSHVSGPSEKDRSLLNHKPDGPKSVEDSASEDHTKSVESSPRSGKDETADGKVDMRPAQSDLINGAEEEDISEEITEDIDDVDGDIGAAAGVVDAAGRLREMSVDSLGADLDGADEDITKKEAKSGKRPPQTSTADHIVDILFAKIYEDSTIPTNGTYGYTDLFGKSRKFQSSSEKVECVQPEQVLLGGMIEEALAVRRKKLSILEEALQNSCQQQPPTSNGMHKMVSVEIQTAKSEQPSDSSQKRPELIARETNGISDSYTPQINGTGPHEVEVRTESQLDEQEHKAEADRQPGRCASVEGAREDSTLGHADMKASNVKLVSGSDEPAPWSPQQKKEIPPRMVASMSTTENILVKPKQVDMSWVRAQLTRLVPRSVEALLSLGDTAVKQIWEARSRGREWRCVDPPSVFTTRTDDAEVLGRVFPGGCPRRHVDKCLVWDLVQEIVTAVYEGEGRPEDPPWIHPAAAGDRPKCRLWRGPERPPTMEKLQELVRAELSDILSFSEEGSAGSIPSQVLVRVGKLARWTATWKRRDRVDGLLVSELWAEEPEWVRYEEDEVTVKNLVADQLWSGLVGDTARALARASRAKKDS